MKTLPNPSAKHTVAHLKKFVRDYRDVLEIRCESDFNGMSDCIEHNPDAKWQPATERDSVPEHTLGVRGVWIVGRSRDRISYFSSKGRVGFFVYNCCGSFTVAVKVNP